MKLRSFAPLSALLLLAAACSVDAQDASNGEDSDDVNEAESVAAKVTPGSFKLYAQPHATPNPGCDVHTKLDLAADHFSTASLEEVVGGFCEIAVVPNPRTYRLRQTGTSCGSRIFAGSVKKQGKSYAIKITDHRSRLCRDLVPAQIIVEETAPGAITTTKYSDDMTVAPPPAGTTVTLEGTLVSTMGIGGENTGSSIQTSSETVELILDAGERNQFVDGKKARAKGTIKLLSGVETHNRKALDVTEMLVCPAPGYVNCMPGPNVRLSNLCSNDNMGWIQANCPGVLYTF
jgi:hypothetical protein